MATFSPVGLPAAARRPLCLQDPTGPTGGGSPLLRRPARRPRREVAVRTAPPLAGAPGPPRDGQGFGRDCFRGPVLPTAANSSRQRLPRGPFPRTLAREGDAGPRPRSPDGAARSAAPVHTPAHPRPEGPRNRRSAPEKNVRLTGC
ncbi:atherin-like isoform X2 [Phyllostomus discolor]|uniref:Atherin-like isoform X2 n=1 Tax=Phyllostomus discolor TaxID=89673 RepID=A0A7E6CJN5_9CHIR|nr:atherin-like isoform X2 [Phyllostomus discolor]